MTFRSRLAVVALFSLCAATSSFGAGNPLKNCTQKDADFGKQVWTAYEELLNKKAISRAEYLRAKLSYIDVTTCHDAASMDYCVEKGKVIDELLGIHEQATQQLIGYSTTAPFLTTLSTFRTQCP
jgi:hypothetical protein